MSHEDHHTHDHSGCGHGEAYEQNLAEQRRWSLNRREFLRTLGISGLVVGSGGINAGSIFAGGWPPPGAARLTAASVARQDADFEGLYFLSGDHHIHTRYSYDAKYPVQRQVAEANYHGLDWMVITDHGRPAHNKLSVDMTYPEIIASREAFQSLLIFTGLEMNIPGGEHGTVIVQPTAAEMAQIKEFEAAYDGAIAADVEEHAVAGLRYLDRLDPKPLFFANHPARRGLDSPHEIRAWKAAAPDVAYGFEGAPGHQAGGLIRDAQGKFVAYRGSYGQRPEPGAFAGYPPESYYTFGGFDWMTATLGGVWDSLLGDGLRWWITANSDAHNYYDDLQDVDRSEYDTLGYVTEVDRYLLRPSYVDFRPGEYSRTYVLAPEPSYAAVMGALRAGQMFVVHGDLIDRLQFTASVRQRESDGSAGLGGTLAARRGDDVQVQIRVRVPAATNFNNQRAMVDHVDLIAGDVNNLSRTAGPDNMVNPSTRVVQTFSRGQWREQGQTDAGTGAEGLVLAMDYTFERVERDFYVRLRGTNQHDRSPTPPMEPDLRGTAGPGISPWDDLWFYSNPIFVRVSA